MIEVQEYIDALGRNGFARWFNSLEADVMARVVKYLERLEAGNTSALKALGAGLLEVRIDSGPGYRVYCGWDGATLIVLLGGGSKRGQKSDIEQARARWQEYKRRKQMKRHL